MGVMFTILDPRLWLAVLLAVAAASGVSYLKGRADGRRVVMLEWKAANAETERQARAQQDRNRDLQRAAELRYTVQAETRQHVITQTIQEVRYVAAPLDSCPVPAAAVRLLNAAASCAREDRPASCGDGESLPVAR